MIQRVSRILDRILMIFVSLLALTILAYSLYVLYDYLYKDRNAYTSYDLKQYYPVMDEDGNISMEELREINSDVIGWLTIPGTNVDYPLLQGEDDLYYASHDVYGKGSLTGSVYLAAENDPNVSDYYSIIYAHHMSNGAMFGDIEKYEDADYFKEHQDGYLTTQNGVWDIHVIACVRTDAYERIVYTIMGRDADNNKELMDYIRKHAVQYNESLSEEMMDGIRKMVALSTCADAWTNGRTVLFCSLTPRDGAIPVEDEDGAGGGLLSAIGHITNNDRWAFLNLVCVIFTIYNLLPLGTIGRKYRQKRFCRRRIRELEESGRAGGAQDTDNWAQRYIRDLKAFMRRMNAGLILEILLLAGSVVLFVFTEDLTLPVTIRDEWTGWMILILFAAWLTDYICYRYRGVLEREEAEQS